MKFAAIVETMSHVQKVSLLTALAIKLHKNYSSDEVSDFIDNEEVNLFDVINQEDYDLLEIILSENNIKSFTELLRYLMEKEIEYIVNPSKNPLGGEIIL
jgi:hypothetical protein